MSHRCRWRRLTGLTLALAVTGFGESGAARAPADVSSVSYIIEEAKLAEPSLTASGGNGLSVDVDGDIAVVGSPYDRVAYVYARSGTTWTREAALTPRGHPNGDTFGWAVAVEGDTIAVGAFHDLGDRGSVSIFERTKNGWARQAKLTASDGFSGDDFGFAVALSGDTLVVGASGDSETFSSQGSAYVFTRSGKKWSEQAKLTASNPGYLDVFGTSVAIDGDTVVIGAFRDNIFFGGQGSAYVFTRSGTTWSQEAQLMASDPGVDDYFGVSVAVHGDTAVVGAYHHDVGGNAEQGAAYVFTRSGTTWSQQAELTASGGGAQANFGISVDIEGDTAVVGAWMEDVGANQDQGAAYVFTRAGTTWTAATTVSASDAVAQDWFGRSVALDGGTLLVGAPGADIGYEFPEQGAAYVFSIN